MKLRIKLFYCCVGFQMAGAMLFAMLQRLDYSILALGFAVCSWYVAEFHMNNQKDNNENN